ncbi:N-acetylmuramic acid 6-phosphate etherase [Enterococcus sp. LJL98]
MVNLNVLTTEARNNHTINLDKMSTIEILETMNKEDQKVPESIKQRLPEIAQTIEQIVKTFRLGGRLIYIGAGTSGRLGVLDAAECVPTFGTPAEMVQGIIAGGMPAMTTAIEGAEDSPTLGKEDLKRIALTNRDLVIGIAASGRTPYVIGALIYAKSIGAKTVAFSCNQGAEISQHADYAIEVAPGPEVLTGSTRLKAGTTQKLVLNMLSTASMIQIGKVYQNLMVDVEPTNLKLVERAKQIIIQATDCSYEEASNAFVASDKNVKVAILMILTNSTKEEAIKKLAKGNGFIRKALEEDR